jgi:type II secretory pathway pseudopilin PulG
MKNRGFILLEIMLSLAILATVFVFAIEAISETTSRASSSRNLTIAAALSQQLFARINLHEFKNGGGWGNFGDDCPDFSWKIDRTKLSGQETLYDYSVSWKEKGTGRELSLATVKFEAGDGQ